jgi:hypothetical protein
LGDADEHAVQGACAVGFEVELALQRVEHGLDPCRPRPSLPNRAGSLLRSGRMKCAPSCSVTKVRKAFVTQQDLTGLHEVVVGLDQGGHSDHRQSVAGADQIQAEPPKNRECEAQ